MNRNYKLRAWDKEKKQMIEGTLDYWFEVCAKTGVNQFHNHIWMEFTQMDDKHGTEIAEGDILKYDMHDAEYAAQFHNEVIFIVNFSALATDRIARVVSASRW